MVHAEEKAIAQAIIDTNNKIEAYKDVEEKKSVLTLKTDQLEKIYQSRFDYVKAIDDVQKLFSYRIIISSITVASDGTATVIAKKNGDLVISEQEALGTNINSMQLALTVGSSEEIQQTVDTLKSYLDKGLNSATVTGSKKTDDGYELNLLLTFGQDTKSNAQ